MSGAKRVVIVDVGLGNIRSVVRALEQSSLDRGLNCSVAVSGQSDEIWKSDAIVLPGQGAFGDCASAFGRNAGALKQVVVECIRAGKPYLGICLGLQVLFDESEEAPGCAGLGIYSGAVRKLTAGERNSGGEKFKLPHIGWNLTERTADRGGGVLTERAWYYYVHSYAAVPNDGRLVSATARHGKDFCAAVSDGNVFAVQFHPEKSQRMGLRLLGDWLQEKRP